MQFPAQGKAAGNTQIQTGPLTQPSRTIPVAFNKPAFLGMETEEILKSIQVYNQISGGGHYTKLCEQWLTQFYGATTLLTTSCTHALEMAAILLELGPGDEVIVPSFTFVSTANAFVIRGATVRFADCDRFGQLSLESVKQLITPQTKAICVVHYAGNSTDMDALAAFCRENHLTLIEDAAQAIGARFNDRLLGTFGDFGCLSFHETKNITSGEGGGLIINNPRFRDRAHYIREKGTNREQFMQGIVDKYTWVDLGSSYVMSDMNAAHLWVQLQENGRIHERRAAIWNRYADELKPPGGVTILTTPDDNQSNHHLFALVFDNPTFRTAFIHYMRQCQITAPFHYVALHSSPYGQKIAQSETHELPNTRWLAEGLVRLPLFYNMTDEEQEWVITCTQRFFQRMGSA